ncbi:proteoglycan 3-like [Dromiciops gliroides]|uniref:proteoglycan 3-like n=1 Tax=Dromiciops gliroides TaxID=33562 RepID=UPI001CC6E912|nr:proteoglycan 3-like [Dromiciops gliroides]XP_043828977.1 proteoglycan 3-like [Dromiciops gliroides]
MKLAFILSFVLLGTVSSLHMRNEAINLEKLEEVDTQAEESKVPEGGEFLASADKSSKKEKEVTESVSAAKDNYTLEAKKEETVYVLENARFHVRYVLIRKLKTFTEAQRYCQQNYRGNLVSIHNSDFNCKLQNLAKRINQRWVWIGAYTTSWFFVKKFKWIDRSNWDFSYWAIGQPLFGWGRCVAMCTNGSGWSRTSCHQSLPFICSY